MSEPTSLATTVAYAQAYARLGWFVFPLKPGTKAPLGRLVPRGMLDATTEPTVIAGWWTREPQAGIGIALAPSGLVAVDVDPRNGGNETFDSLQAEHGSLRSDVMAMTGGGGEHHVFAIPAGHQVSLPGTLGPGVDLKANGYIVVEPTFCPLAEPPHVKPYEWEASSNPLDGIVPSPLPDWLRSLRIDLKPAAAQPTMAPIDERQLRDAREALYVLDADDHDTWVRAGMALHSTGWGHAAYAVWCAWAQQSPKFDSTEHRKRWASFHTDGDRSLRLSFIFAQAQAAGWKNPGAKLERVAVADVGDLRPLSLSALAQREPEPIRFVVDKWLPSRAVTVLTAHGGVGKSTMSLQLAVCIALGLPWFSIPTSQGQVLLISCEDAEQAIHWRLSNVCKHLGVSLASLEGKLHIFDMTERDCVLWAKGQVTPRMQWLADTCASIKPQCVIVDNASDTFADNENDRTAVRGFVRSLARIAIDIDGAMLLLAHVDKASARGTVESSDSYSGSTAWNNSARSRWAMLRNKDKSIEISNEKNNYAAIQDPFTIEYDLVQHVFVNGDAGGASVASALVRNATRLAVMRAIGAANDAGDRMSMARKARNSALVICGAYGLPKDTPQDIFWSTLDILLKWKFATLEQYKQANRTIGEHVVLTEAGRGRVAIGSGAAPAYMKDENDD